jgi:hypothetical protein
MAGSSWVGLLLGFVLAVPGLGPTHTPSAAVAGEIAGSAVTAGTIAPQNRSWRIEDFHSDVRVLATGATEVTERIRVRFDGIFNGIYRTIPIEYRDTRNFNVTLRLEVAGVEDGSGTPLRYELSRERQYRKIKVWVPGAEDTSRTVVIRYRAKNALLHFSEDELEWDELYWNVTGDEWPVPIDASSVRVQLPGDVTGIRARAFTGRYGSTETAADLSVDESARTVEVRSREGLGIHEGLTVVVAWDARAAGGEYVVKRPGAMERAIEFLRSNWPLVIPALVFFFMYRIWSRVGKDPEKRPVATRYEPPERMTPFEVGVLVDNRPDMRDVTSTLVDLAVRGWLVIEQIDDEKLFGLVKDRDYAFVLQKPMSAAGELKPHERELLEALFEEGSETRVEASELANSFYKDLPAIKSAVFDELVEDGYYRRRPDHVQGAWIGGGIFAAGALAVLGIMAAGNWGMSVLTVILAAALSAVIIIGFGLLMPARTIKGARAQEAILGFEEFLDRVESDRFRRMITGPEMFERFLPYAMALGVEKKWAAAFADIYREPPNWYRGPGYATFRPAVFVADLGNMSSATASAMTAAPRSVGSSGMSGGGGFSGGGFGGGGGGAF